MNFLATDGSDLYVTKKKDNDNYDWKKLHSIYHKEYSNITKEMTIIPNKNIIYDIYILPIWDEKYHLWLRNGFQCLFSLTETSETKQSFYLENSKFRLYWNENGDNKIFITYGNSTDSVDFRIRTITIEDNIVLEENHNIYTGIDIINKTLNTGIFNNTGNIYSIHTSTGTQTSKSVFENEDGGVSEYQYSLPKNDNKLYLFNLSFTVTDDSPLFAQFTYANGKMKDGKVGPLKKPINCRYINENLQLKEECSIQYYPDDSDDTKPDKSYLSITLSRVNYKIKSLSYTCLTI